MKNNYVISFELVRVKEHRSRDILKSCDICFMPCPKMNQLGKDICKIIKHFQQSLVD